jgi:hypothetical protein
MVKSQILYTDIEPDSTLYSPLNSTGDTVVGMLFDINQDGINDFYLRAEHFFYWIYEDCCWNLVNEVRSINPNQVLRFPEGSPPSAQCMVPVEQTDTINDQGDWQMNGPLSLSVHLESVMFYCYQPDGSHFYGFRILIEDKYHYGWLRISSDMDFITLYDMAINLTPNEYIIPGQITTRTNFISSVNPDLMLYPNPSKSLINITVNHQPLEEATIFNHLGQKVLNAKPVNNTVDISGLKAGMYLMEVSNKDRTERIKFVKN